MPDTKSGRDKQAREEERRRIERDISEARERGDEAEPDSQRACYRRGCDEPATFRLTERYRGDAGDGAVEASALLCADHTVAEGPANLDSAYEEYVFRIEPIAAGDDD